LIELFIKAMADITKKKKDSAIALDASGKLSARI
jgi:hypothetical protein